MCNSCSNLGSRADIRRDSKGKMLVLTVSKIPEALVERDGKQYRWTLPHFDLHGHGKVTAEEAALDEDILDKIFGLEGQGILVEQH